MKKVMFNLFICTVAILLMAACQNTVPKANPIQSMAMLPDKTAMPNCTSSIDSESIVVLPLPTMEAAENTESVQVETEAPKEAEYEAYDDMTLITMEINGQGFTATLENNETVQALLEKFPLTLDMGELNGNEKYNYLNFSLPTDAEAPGQIHAGDLMLYGDDCLVLFYESFSSGYSYTRIGSLNDPTDIKSVVGGGSVTVTFDLA